MKKCLKRGAKSFAEALFYLGISVFFFIIILISQFPTLSIHIGIFVSLFFAVLFFILSILLFCELGFKLQQKIKWSLKILTSILFLFFLLAIFLIYIFPISERTTLKQITSDLEQQQSRCNLIILGGGVDKDNRPTPLLEARLQLGLAFYQKNRSSISKIYVSGGKGLFSSISEGDVMRLWLEQHGIPKNLIISERNATSSWENLKYIKNLKIGIEKEFTVLVSSHFHLFRVRLLMRREKFNSFRLLGSQILFPEFIPTLIREFLAIGKSFIFDR